MVDSAEVGSLAVVLAAGYLGDGVVAGSFAVVLDSGLVVHVETGSCAVE